MNIEFWCNNAGRTAQICSVDGHKFPRRPPVLCSVLRRTCGDRCLFLILCWLRVSYATELVPGPTCVRPWALGFRADFSFSGFQEPEDVQMLIELIMASGFSPQGVLCVQRKKCSIQPCSSKQKGQLRC